MLTIRRHQSAMFVQLAVDRFVGEIVADLRERLPQHHATLGEDGVREVVRYGIGRSASYGIASEAGARVFIQMMFVFGAAFDSDPKLPWASRWLRAEGSEETRVRGLFAAASEHVRQLAAPGR